MKKGLTIHCITIEFMVFSNRGKNTKMRYYDLEMIKSTSTEDVKWDTEILRKIEIKKNAS